MKKTFKILMLIIMFLLTVSIATKVNAATGSFSVSPTSKTLAKGKTVTVTISTKNCAGKFSITSSNSDVASVSPSSLWIPDDGNTVKITAKKAGTAVITIKAVDVADTSTNIVTGSKTVTIKVTDSSSKNNTTTDKKEGNTDTTKKDENTKSSNANLSTLGVTPKEQIKKLINKTKRI